jgi:hypothetical protein
MEEKNRNSLKKAIDNLPEYSPKDKLWDNLSDNLDGDQASSVLDKAINELPVYQAPADAWVHIEKHLAIKRRPMWPKVLAIAASLALIVMFARNYTSVNFEKEIVKVSHKEKIVAENQLVQTYDVNAAHRDSAFRAIIRAQKESSDRAKEILAEIEKLDKSKKRLKSRLSPYDVNKELEEKLNLIEKEAAELQQAYLATI